MTGPNEHIASSALSAFGVDGAYERCPGGQAAPSSNAHRKSPEPARNSEARAWRACLPAARTLSGAKGAYGTHLALSSSIDSTLGLPESMAELRRGISRCRAAKSLQPRK